MYLLRTYHSNEQEEKYSSVGERNTDVVEIISVTSLFIEEDYRPHEDQHGGTLPDDVKTLYNDSTNKQLRCRLSTKFGKLITTSTENDEIN